MMVLQVQSQSLNLIVCRWASSTNICNIKLIIGNILFQGIFYLFMTFRIEFCMLYETKQLIRDIPYQTSNRKTTSILRYSLFVKTATSKNVDRLRNYIRILLNTSGFSQWRNCCLWRYLIRPSRVMILRNKRRKKTRKINSLLVLNLFSNYIHDISNFLSSSGHERNIV